MKNLLNASAIALLLLAGTSLAADTLGNDGLPAGPEMPKPTMGPDGKPVFPPGPPPVQKLVPAVPIALALEAAKAAVAACAPQHVGIAILDSTGLAKLYYIADGATGIHAKTGFKKANTALAFNMPTSGVGKLIVSDKDAAAKFAAGGDTYIGWAGGVPIYAQGKLVGSIGVSGAEPSAVDEACGVKAIKQIQARLDKSTQPPK